MKENKIVEVIKPIRLELLKEKFILPPEIQAKVDAYWEELSRKNAFFRRGEAFAITSTKEKEGVIKIEFALTDYAHYIYTRAVGMPEKYAFSNLHTSCVIETADAVLIFGRTGENTANVGIWQCVGGGLDHDDVRGSEIDLEHNIKKELREEVGIDVNEEKAVSDLKLKYLKYTSNERFSSIAAIFLLKLKLTEKEFRAHYEKFEKELSAEGKLPEFQELTYLSKNETAIQEFLRSLNQDSLDCYMEALLGEIVSKEKLEIAETESKSKNFLRLA
jgi:predicted NUDIX family phosphoesterase